MISFFSKHRLLAVCTASWLAGGAGQAARVPLAGVEASYGEDKTTRLPQVIDGRDTGRVGWSVFPRTGEAHALFVRTREPVRAKAFDLTLCFLSGLPKRYCGNFAISYTTDANPALTGQWQRVLPLRFTATGPTLTLEDDGRLVASGSDSMIGDAIFQIRIAAPQPSVTGFRIEVFPFERPDIPGPRVAWGEYRDFCLTEFRVESITEATTNIALGQPVTASHRLWAGLSGNVLTDGLPGSFNHPAEPGLGSSFHFDLDLGAVRQLDHFALRNRADGYGMDRMSGVRIQLYDRPPETGAQPVWEAVARPDGTYPGPGEVELVHLRQGTGVGRGQYVRLSSDSAVAHAPQFAEVEAYPTLTPKVLGVKVDGQPQDASQGLVLPAGTSVLAVQLAVPGSNVPENLPVRWRLRGADGDWKLAPNLAIEIAHPPPGTFRLEAQVQHTDREWDSSLLSVPIVVQRHFWQTPAFYVATSLGLILAAALVARRIGQQREARRLAALEYQSALAEERSRIARDMHDEVGARLSQLALMQDLIMRRHALPPQTEQSLRELAHNTRQTVDALDQVVWAVNPLHDTLTGVAEYLGYTASSYLTPLNIHFRLDAPYEWPEVEVRAQVRHQLILALREALQNIAKHAAAANVTLTLRYESPVLTINVADDGRGLPGDHEGPGKEGLNNMKSRLHSIGGTCEIRPRREGGTEVELRAPLPNSW
jgi:signal transduction histidine kinase